jgi:serine/threonine protein kinase
LIDAQLFANAKPQLLGAMSNPSAYRIDENLPNSAELLELHNKYGLYEFELEENSAGRIQYAAQQRRSAERSAHVVISMLPYHPEKNMIPTVADITNYTHAYEITKTLWDAGVTSIIRPVLLHLFYNTHDSAINNNGKADAIPRTAALVSDYFPRTNLEYLLHSPSASASDSHHYFNHYSFGDLLGLCISCASTLHEIHAQNVIHQSVRTANLLVDVRKIQIKLYNFGTSMRTNQSGSSNNSNNLKPLKSNVLDNSLCFLSPEQTGRVARTVDYRSDLYSLGIVMYELFSGKLPFEASDNLELMHSILAIPPRPIQTLRVSNQRCPPILNRIILKLLAKDADQRYSSAKGLQYDLIRINEYIERQHISDSNLDELSHLDFTVAEYDIPHRLPIPLVGSVNKLYGRAEKFKTFQSVFDRVVADKRPRTIIVKGSAGVGKTALVQSFLHHLEQNWENLHPNTLPPFIVRTKLDQFTSTPFAMFKSLTNSYLHQILSENHSVFERWRARLLQAVGENGGLVVELYPLLEQIIGKQPSAVHVEPAEAQKRLQLVLNRFTVSLLQPDRPAIWVR